MLSVEEIAEKLRANYDPVVNSLPGRLREEFRSRVFTIRDLVEYASFIRTTTEFEGEAAPGQTLRKIHRKVSVKAFNSKLVEAGIHPDDIYSALLQGVFEFE
jgi:hypothetical protein